MSLPPLPEVVGERYRPIRLIGRGGGGAVYEVEHLHTGARVALKLLAGFEGASPEAVARFKREARLAAAIDSEHVVRITDAGTADEMAGTPFLVMELMQGRTLEQEGHVPIEPTRVVELLSQAARALERAHAAGIIHRDLKPDNMFLTQREDGSPWVKLLDFGIAKHTTSAVSPGGGIGTEQGTVLGTPIYMSPEQAQGQASLVDSRTDTWALGMIAFRLLFGIPYFAPDHTLRLLHRVVFEPVTPPSELGFVSTPAFDAWFLRSCSHDRSQRFVSPAEQIRELGQALGELKQVVIKKHILEARAQRHSASTEQQVPTVLEAGYTTPVAPWSDGPQVQAPRPARWPGDDAAVSLAGSTPNLPAMDAITLPRTSVSKAILPMALALVVLVSGAFWLWKITRHAPITEDVSSQRAAPSRGAPTTTLERAAAVPSPPAIAEDKATLSRSAPDAAVRHAEPTAPSPATASPVVRKPSARPTVRKPSYDPLGDRL